MVIDVTQNEFVDIVQHYGIWNGQKYDLCSQILNASNNGVLLYQLTHLISIQNSQNSRIVIGSNNFTNLSITGPLIFMEESDYSNQNVIIQNIFRLIHGYVNSNAIQVQRKGIYFGGNLLISGNHFSKIAGCPTVQAGAIMVGIIYLNSTGRDSLSLNLPEESQSMLSQQLSPDPLYAFSHQSYGNLYLNSNTAILENNTFINMSMGVARQIGNQMAKGALIKFVNIPHAQISSSTFINIGAYTVEHSRQLQAKLFGISEELISSNEKTELNLGQVPENKAFMKTYLSTSLICGHGMSKLILGPSNKFSNIWLIDKFNSFDRYQLQGIILYLEQFKGDLTIGGEQGGTTIDSITGFINPQTIERFKNWDPQMYPQVMLNDKMIQGAGSILFNIHNNSNSFDKIIIQNLHITVMHHRSIERGNTLAPSIISTTTNSSLASTPVNVTLSGIQIYNSSFDGSSGYFELQAQTPILDNINMDNVGSWDMLSEKSLKGLEVKEAIQINSVSSSIFVVSIIDEYASGVLQFSNSSFTHINTLPILQIQAKQFEDQTKLINITDVLVSKCLPDREGDLPPSALFQIAIQGQDNVQMEIQVSKVRIEDTQSKYGIFNIHGGQVSSIAISTSVFKRMKGYYSSILYLNDQPATSIVFQLCIFIGNSMTFIDNDVYLVTEDNDASDEYDQVSLFNFERVKNVTFIDCVARDNHFASNGSFLYLSVYSEVTLQGCSFTRMSSYKGGVIFAFHKSIVSIFDCKFTDNRAIDAGVILASESSSVNISSSVFQYNKAIYNGVFKFQNILQFQQTPVNSLITGQNLETQLANQIKYQSSDSLITQYLQAIELMKQNLQMLSLEEVLKFINLRLF
ncbi:hypothetical protein FGO68_gene4330 [Halteria grandinella]|uniref:Right handed beta helix domain-containing protein n=1 Tax=Halteria grandinella TaxID=5974 RepID=A0A8J8SYG4_HALGN|nr:hypothetical protein FGO68_gene4330 [Halteria grandinella]